jgi:hypothetical protein
MPRGDVLTLSSMDETRDGMPGVSIRIADTGKGIGPEARRTRPYKLDRPTHARTSTLTHGAAAVPAPALRP